MDDFAPRGTGNASLFGATEGVLLLAAASEAILIAGLVLVASRVGAGSVVGQSFLRLNELLLGPFGRIPLPGGGGGDRSTTRGGGGLRSPVPLNHRWGLLARSAAGVLLRDAGRIIAARFPEHRSPERVGGRPGNTERGFSVHKNEFIRLVAKEERPAADDGVAGLRRGGARGGAVAGRGAEGCLDRLRHVRDAPSQPAPRDQPQTRERITIDSTLTPGFTASSTFKARVLGELDPDHNHR